MDIFMTVLSGDTFRRSYFRGEVRQVMARGAYGINSLKCRNMDICKICPTNFFEFLRTYFIYSVFWWGKTG